MFITKSHGRYTVWNNDEHTDWARYLPMRLDSEKEDIDLWFVPKGQRRNLSEAMRLYPELVIDSSDFMTVGKRLLEGGPLEEIMSAQLTKVTVWPYDADEKFLGFSELG